jgi:hypothetical protein
MSCTHDWRIEYVPVGECTKCRARQEEIDAYRRGAEAMREACAREVVEGRQNSHEGMMQWFEDIASDVRDLPIPEEP